MGNEAMQRVLAEHGYKARKPASGQSKYLPTKKVEELVDTDIKIIAVRDFGEQQSKYNDQMQQVYIMDICTLPGDAPTHSVFVRQVHLVGVIKSIVELGELPILLRIIQPEGRAYYFDQSVF